MQNSNVKVIFLYLYSATKNPYIINFVLIIYILLLFVQVLRLIKDAQAQHGLRHGDYQRYRGYCTRRIERLRKFLKLPQGEKRHYKKRDVLVSFIEGQGADRRYLHIPLMLAERAWAYAMQLRQESNTEPRKKFHLISKLRKASGYALQLQELCQVWK